MGTRADFYIGRGKEATWLGSIANDGYPDGIEVDVLMATTQETYEAALMRFFAGRDDVSGPDHGWPWPWEDSTITDYAYAFDSGKVWAHGWGWFDPLDADGDDKDSEAAEAANWGPSRSEFPDMTDVQNVTLGARSGLIVFGGSE